MRLSSIRRGDTVRCTVELSGKTVPVENPILMVMLPGSLKLDETACQVDGASFEPELSGPVVTFRLQDGEGDWQRKVELSAELVEESADGTAKAVVMFDTPTQKRQRMPVAEISVLEEHSDSGALSADTVGAYETDEPETDESEDDRDADEHGAGWLNGLEPGIEWVEPGPGYMPPIPSLNLGIKHEPHQSITLLLEGEKVNTLNFEGSLKNSDKTVVVSRWRGIDLEEGDNHFEAIVADREGKEIARLARMFHYSGKPVKVEFLPERSVLVADGRTVPAIAVRLTDKDGYPARERVVGEYSVFSPFVPYRDESVEQDILLPEGDARWRPRYRVGKDGVAMLELEPTTRSGEAVISLRLQDGDEEIRAWLEPALREWILVGFAEGTAGYQTLEEHARALPDDERFEDFTHDDRIAFFAKGQIKGEWLLTIAYDNTKESTQQHDRESLNQIIDPDSFYTLYGDDTVQDYEAPSAEKLYVKIERSKFYAMYGDYETGLTVTDLSAYSRSLTGLKTEYRGDRFQFNAFATETNQAFVKDEIRGDGTSGLYHLSRDSIVINSENVTIETRDRFHSERILDSSTLTRHLDYNIDYNAGTIYFKRPVMSRDEELNPIYIVVDYESVDQGDRSYTYGGRGAAKMLDDKIEVGATHIHEGRVGGEGELNGIDLAYDITENTRFRAETARTETDFDGEKLVGTARLAEITHESGKLSATAYARDQEGEFGLGQQMGTESGTRKVGANAAYYLTEKLNITGEVYRQENTGTDSDRKVLNLAANYLGERLSLKGGYLAARDNLGDGSTNRSDEIQAGIGYAFFDQRLRLRVDHAQAISGNNESSDFPNRTIFGADYSLTERTRIFGEYEITEGGTEASQALRAGLGLVPWSGADLNTGITQEMRGNGNRTFANAGLFQTLQLTEEWSIDAGVDMTQSIKSRKGQTWNTDVPSASGGSEDFLAISLGATRQAENWTWSNRIEQRTSDTEDSHNLFTGVVGDVSRNLALSLSASLFNTDSATGEESMSADIRLGLAYRPLDPRWIVLDRLDLIYDDQTGDTIDTTTWRIVNHFDANYQPREDLQMSFRYACKFVSETVEKDDFSGFTDLFGFEARYDIFERWDIGFRTSARHSWNTNQLAYSFGPSLGFSPAKNFWISVGYNVDGFDDRDFGRTGYTGQGAYVQFRMKFDQETAGELREYLNN